MLNYFAVNIDYHGITNCDPRDLDMAMQIWIDKNERFPISSQVVHVSVQEASDTEPPGPGTDLYRFLLEFAKHHNMWSPKSREWRRAVRFYALLFNAGRLSAQRERNPDTPSSPLDIRPSLFQ